MKKYMIATDWARVPKGHKLFVWHNDPDSNHTVECEEDVSLLKKIVADEIAKHAHRSDTTIVHGELETLMYNQTLRAYLNTVSDISIKATAPCKDGKSQFGNWVRVRAFEDWFSWINK